MADNLLRVGIDASNIQQGGGLTHLIQLLEAADPGAAGIGDVFVWSRATVLSKLPERPWLHKRHLPVLDKHLAWRIAWQQLLLSRALRRERCDILFAPAGLLPRQIKIATVTMSRNMLPFEPTEAARYGVPSALWLKMQLLRWGQAESMQRANGLIFLTDYARHAVLKIIGSNAQEVRTIPHGLAERFFSRPRAARPMTALDETQPFRLLYVSTIDMYKHQWQVVRAAGAVRKAGVPVKLDLIGLPVLGALNKLKQAMNEVDPAGQFITYHNSVPFEELHQRYQQSDLFVYASSCENLPNILLEAMAAGLPIACSRMGPMPEVLGDSGVYFDPLDSRSIEEAIRLLIDDPAKRERLAHEAFARARSFSWQRCARDTFAFIADVGRHYARRPT